MKTYAPSATKRLAVARPSPLLPPVISAIFPLNLFIYSSCDRQTMCLDDFSTRSGWEEAGMIGKRTGLGSWGLIRAKHRLERLGIKNLPSMDSGFFCATSALQQRHQVFGRGQARPVPLQRFDHALIGALAGPQHQQQGGDEDTVNLDLHAGGRFG